MSNTQILHVKVTPKASKDMISGWTDSSPRELSVRVSAAPEKGKSNDAIIKLIASSIGVPKANVEIARGHTSRHKQVAIEVDEERFNAWCDSL